jgi:signal transduction histidine kinase
MNFVYSILNHMKNNSEFNKKLVILISFLLCLLVGLYIHIYLKQDIIYTHLFYIPIILTAFWYGIKSLYLALLVGLLHIGLNYMTFVTISMSSVHRALIIIAIATVIYIISNFRYGKFPFPAEFESKEGKKPDCRSQQINMVGQLGVAVGHEIRNPLTTVRGFLQLMDGEIDPQDLREYLSIMIEEIDRADEAITHLINLAENKTNNPEEYDLNEIVNESLSNYPIPQYPKIRIKSRLHKLPKLMLDKLEIKELVLHLLNNAVEAMPNGGTIIIVTRQVGVEGWLIIRDQGSGISEEIAQHIGTPFFSTKEKSAGLGLAICYSIARRHGARIEFVSNPKGTRFVVRFPLGFSHTSSLPEQSPKLTVVSRL